MKLARFHVMLGLLLLITAGVAAAAQPVDAVLGVTITVSDLNRAADFYTGTLDFQLVERTERTVELRLGDESVTLVQPESPGREIPADSRSNDRWFQHIAVVTTDMDRAYARLTAAGVKRVSPEPQTLPAWNPNAGGIRAFYFLDPDRHVLEVIQFPPGKGDARWQSARTLFPGIDHTAIVVADTDASLRFYRDQLGMKVVGGSENYGLEQQRLNNVPGAHLRITTLRAPRGPGIELLQYLSPADGRPYPADTQPNDLWRWITRVRSAGAPGRIMLDPDGHRLAIFP